MRWVAALLFLVIFACSGATPAPDPNVPTVGLPPPPDAREPAASAAERAPSQRDPARDRFDTVTISENVAADPLASGPHRLDRRVDLELAHAPVAEAFRFLADAADVNIVLADDVSGDVTLRLRQVTVRDALRAVAATRDLRTEWRGNILWVGAD